MASQKKIPLCALVDYFILKLTIAVYGNMHVRDMIRMRLIFQPMFLLSLDMLYMVNNLKNGFILLATLISDQNESHCCT